MIIVNCQIQFNYPKVHSSSLGFSNLNGLLKNIPDYNYHAQNCDDSRFSKTSIEGDFKILLQTDEFLSIEFIKRFKSDDINKVDSMISGFVINPIAFETNKGSKGEINIHSIIPNFKRGSLYKYVKQYNETRKANVNLNAYQSESNYHINWTITDRDFILYLGGEGEIFGHDKISIPLDELKKENDL